MTKPQTEFDDPAVKQAFLALEAVAERFLMTTVDGKPVFAVGGFFALLLEESAASAERASQAAKSGNQRAEVGASAAAILSAAAACETFLAEFLTRAEMFRVLDAAAVSEIRSERQWSAKWKLVVRARGQQGAAAKTFDFGTSTEYARLNCLFRIRNHLAHRYSRLTPLDSWPPELADCMKATVPTGQERFFDWGTGVCRAPVARWAAETASRWIEVIEPLITFSC